MLDFLSGEHEVTLLTPAPAKGQPPPPEAAAVPGRALPAGEALAALRGHGPGAAQAPAPADGLFYQPDLGRKLRELAPRNDLGILQLVRLAIHLEDFGDTPLVVDLIDSLSLNFSLRADVDRSWMRAAAQDGGAAAGAGPSGGWPSGRGAYSWSASATARRWSTACRRSSRPRSPWCACRCASARSSAARGARGALARGGQGARPGDHRQPRLLRQRGRGHLVAADVWPQLRACTAGCAPGGRGRPAGAALRAGDRERRRRS